MKNIKKILESITKKINWKRYGSYDSKLFGEWVEKIDNRIYNAGDNANRINRKLTAKTDNIIIDQHIRESSLNLFLYFDINYNRNSWNKESFIKTTQEIIEKLNSHLSKENHHSEIYFNWVKWIEKSHYKIKEHKLLKQQLYEAKKTSLVLDQQGLVLNHWGKKAYFSWLNNFLKKISNKKNNIIIIFTDSFALDKQNTNLIHHLQWNNTIHLFILDNYQDGSNYHNFDISFPQLWKWISYTLI